MKKISGFLNRCDINRFRAVMQIAALAVIIYGGMAAIDLGSRLPTFSCPFNETSCGSCYLYGFQHQMTIPAKQIKSRRGLGILTGLITFGLMAILLHKSWCGFLCPLGTIQDLITRLRKKLGVRYATYSEKTFNRLSKIKYILLVLLILIPLGIGNSLLGLPKLSHDFATPYCMICPGRTVLPLLTLDGRQLAIDFSSSTKMILTTLGMMITGVFLAGAFVKKRFFCLFCPMSALLHLFSKGALLRLNKDGDKCTRC
ncbi:4Fe-4S binding protein, partial [Acidobacteriota bacterium]